MANRLPLQFAGSQPGTFLDTADYIVDRWQRSVLFMDVLRKRGNNYLKHLSDGLPPVLSYPYEMICDGRQFDSHPVNYALVKIIPDDRGSIDPKKRPIIVVDPRAGHGPGIGGSKKDSEIGAALGDGHPTYFILFYPDPVPEQTIPDIERAEARFVEEVSRRHPKAPPPSVIGNCQAGWAAALLGADRPDIMGPMVLAGSPMSYWAGEAGFNTMRYKGGLLGGSWLTSFLSDLGNGIFDGAYLVSGFEDLNPANTLWKKEYNLFCKIDSEEERYLNFEKWWSGYYYMNGEEMQFIVDNLFVGNKLQTGDVSLGSGKHIDLKNLRKPVIVFASKGDNITPPMQALNWIEDVYGTVDEIRRQQKVLIYLLHREIGHLGIFVSSSVGKKEHREIVGSIDQVGFLPPGLYEMVIDDSDETLAWGNYRIRFEEREIKDILALDDGREDEDVFAIIDRVSKWNRDIYTQFLRPFVRAFMTDQAADVFRQLHPLRVSRYGFSNRNPLMAGVQSAAKVVRENRREISRENPYLKLENTVSDGIVAALDCYREIRDEAIEFWVKIAYGNPWMRTFMDGMVPSPSDEEKQHEKITSKEDGEAAAKRDRDKWIEAMEEGGFVEAVLRIIAAVGSADHIIDKRELTEAFKIVGSNSKLKGLETTEYKRIVAEQSRILQTDRNKAVESLGVLLPSDDERQEAYRIAEKLASADRVMADEELALLNKIKTVLNVDLMPQAKCEEKK